jgi:acyl dehydratase
VLVHTVEEVGEKAGTGIIAHGMLVMGMAAQGVTTWVPRKYVDSIQIRFRKMVIEDLQLIRGKDIKK